MLHWQKSKLVQVRPFCQTIVHFLVRALCIQTPTASIQYNEETVEMQAYVSLTVSICIGKLLNSKRLGPGSGAKTLDWDSKHIRD